MCPWTRGEIIFFAQLVGRVRLTLEAHLSTKVLDVLR